MPDDELNTEAKKRCRRRLFTLGDLRANVRMLPCHFRMSGHATGVTPSHGFVMKDVDIIARTSPEG